MYFKVIKQLNLRNTILLEIKQLKFKATKTKEMYFIENVKQWKKRILLKI